MILPSHLHWSSDKQYLVCHKCWQTSHSLAVPDALENWMKSHQHIDPPPKPLTPQPKSYPPFSYQASCRGLTADPRPPIL